MIQSRTTRDDLATDWATLEDMVELTRSSWTEVDVGYAQFEFTKELAVCSLNLCVLFAISILERTLLHLQSEGHFRTKDSSLYGLMVASRNAGFSWRDFDRMEGIRKQRNNLAHRQARYTEDECLVMLLAIADQLEELSIVSARRRVFMHSRGLYAPTGDGRRFHLEILFRADADSDFQQRVFELAAAKQSRDGTTSEITESVKRRVTAGPRHVPA